MDDYPALSRGYSCSFLKTQVIINLTALAENNTISLGSLVEF